MKLSVNEVQPGMRTLNAVKASNDFTVIPANIEITSHMINLLFKWNIDIVDICSNDEKIISKTELFEELYYDSITKTKNIFDEMRDNEQVLYKEFYNLVTFNLYHLLDEKNLIVNLYRLKSSIDYTYIHSVDVGLLCGLIGKWCRFKEEKIKLLMITGLMHDIGKSQIPEKLLTKKDKLDLEQMNVIRLHSLYGYYMVRELINKIPTDVQQGILQHHERENGQGYPFAYKSENINSFAKIVAIADTYDAMTSNRSYKKSITPFKALGILSEQIATSFDRNFCGIFIDRTLKSMIGAKVILSDKSYGEILSFDNLFSVSPIIKKNNGVILDLGEVEDLDIEEVLEFDL